ncbi:hemicentin-2-like isoform X2 [Apus apus]|uniref:hemicentin-2-like isoform X2 n=1 Tax=Apus apus TaxID=8895 RepID=UPI0021F89800|nr:hemicentin-2-like isoform X2 [Apus apus]
MSPWLLVAIRGSLWLVLQGCSAALGVTESRVAAEGSSVLLQAPELPNINLTEWEFIPSSSPQLILQHYTHSSSPVTYSSAFQGRVIFYPQNSSILLQRLRVTDSGIYRATVDLMQDKARTTLLEVLKPVSQPEIQYSPSLAGSPIELTCVVPEGMVASISWKKEGRPLPPEKCYQLSGNTTVLQIQKGEKSDCGSYSCNVSNRVSWKETALNLTLAGLTPPLHHAQRLVVIALIFITGSTASFVVLLCQRRLGEKAQKHLIVFTHGLLCISSVLLLATSIIWLQEEGPSAAFILLGLFLCAAVIGAAWAAVDAMWRPAATSHLKTQRWQRVILNPAAPTTLVVNLLFTILLLHNIQQLHERGCSEATDLTTYACVTVAILAMLLLLLIFLTCHRNKQQKMMGSPHTSQAIYITAHSVVEETRGQKQEGE